MIRNKLLVMLGVLGLLASTSVAMAPQAAASIYCHTTGRQYSVHDGYDIAAIGWFNLKIEVCTNGDQITSTQGWSDGATNSWGQLGNYRFHIGAAYRNGFNSGGFGGGSVLYRADGSVKSCYGVGFLSVCSAAEDFKLVGTVTMLNQLIIKPTGDQFVLDRRVFDPNYTWGCTNDACNGNLHM